MQDFDFFKGVFEANKVYAADVCRNAGVISDWLFWGRPNAMKKILNTYDLMPEHNKNNINMTSGEDLINATLKQKMIKRQKLPIDVRLIRKDDAFLFSDQWIWETMLKENYLN